MAEDDGSGHFSPVIIVVAGCVTHNAFESSNALWVTQPITYFQNKNMLRVGMHCGLPNLQHIFISKYVVG